MVSILSLGGNLSLETEIVTITRKEYEDLQYDSEILGALRAAGVDNWDGWDYAMEMLEDK